MAEFFMKTIINSNKGLKMCNLSINPQLVEVATGYISSKGSNCSLKNVQPSNFKAFNKMKCAAKLLSLYHLCKNSFDCRPLTLFWESYDCMESKCAQVTIWRFPSYYIWTKDLMLFLGWGCFIKGLKRQKWLTFKYRK